jgi:hypothetical protein
VGYLLLADSHTYVCRTWGGLAARSCGAGARLPVSEGPARERAMWTGLCCPRSRRGSCRKLRALEICREAMHISLLVWAVIVILGSRVGTLTEALPLRVKLSRRRFALT